MATNPRNIPRAALARAFGNDNVAIRAMELISRDVDTDLPASIAGVQASTSAAQGSANAAQSAADAAQASANAAQSAATSLAGLEFVTLASSTLAPNAEVLDQALIEAQLGFSPANKAGDTITGPLVVEDEITADGLNIVEGTNARLGVVTLFAGSAAISTTAVSASSRIFLSIQDFNTGTPGALYVTAITPGLGFSISSTSGTDASDVAWLIVDAAP